MAVQDDVIVLIDIIVERACATVIRTRAEAIVALDLGPRSEREIMRSRLRDIDAQRFTNIDRQLIAGAREAGLVQPAHRDGIEQALRAGRLQALERLGLATEAKRGRWRLAADLEERLRELGRRGDIIRTLDRVIAQRAPERRFVPCNIHAPGEAASEAVVGRILERGLSDEHGDRHYIVVEGIDGRHHYAEIGSGADSDASQGDIIKLAPRSGTPSETDKRIAEIAARHGGAYSVALHLADDPVATPA